MIVERINMDAKGKVLGDYSMTEGEPDTILSFCPNKIGSFHPPNSLCKSNIECPNKHLLTFGQCH